MNKIGSLLTSGARAVESPESGAFTDSIESGVRTRTVSNVYHCYKSETRAVLAALAPSPEALLSAGGRNPDGTLANFVNWGGGFSLSDADVSDKSPNFSKIIARYSATDPAGGAATPPTGVATGCIIGRPWEGGRRYVETMASGRSTEERVYDVTRFGWCRLRTVSVALVCEKCDARTVADSLALAPASLTTNSHSGAKIEWGTGFGLIDMNGAPLSPSLYSITAKYRRYYAEAIVAPPPGIVLSCSEGVCAIEWKNTRFEALDSGFPELGWGLDVDNPGPSGYTIRLLCNGVVFDAFTPTAASGDKVLAWTIAGDKATLSWCGEKWREYDV
jgi:hypothetical protein